MLVTHVNDREAGDGAIGHAPNPVPVRPSHRGSEEGDMNKLDSARLLILGMDSLRPDGLTPVSKWAADAANTFDDAVDQQRFAMALTCTVLYPIVVELVVKHIWEQEHGRDCSVLSRCAQPICAVVVGNPTRRGSSL